MFASESEVGPKKYTRRRDNSNATDSTHPNFTKLPLTQILWCLKFIAYQWKIITDDTCVGKEFILICGIRKKKYEEKEEQ